MGCSSEKNYETLDNNKPSIQSPNNLDIKMNKNDKNKDNIMFISDPNNIQYLKDLTRESYITNCCDNIFIVFISLDNVPYLVYTNRKYSILFYNLKEDKIINEIPNAHGRWEISNFRHFLDIINAIDLIISVSNVSNDIKIWNLSNYECILHIENIIKKGYLNSAFILNDNNINYVISDSLGTDPIMVFDYKDGSKIKEINDSNEKSFFIDNYYDKRKSVNYIITGCCGYVKSYDFNNNILYHKYYEDGNDSNHFSVVVYCKSDDIQLIESCNDGNIRLWNFHMAQMIKKIQVSNQPLFGLNLWNSQYLLIGCEEKAIKLIDLNDGLVAKCLNGHNKPVTTVKKIIILQYGECLISQGLRDDQIKLWINKK
jgi:hypothetical protein